MELRNNKYVAYSIIVVLVAVVAFNFENLTGYASKTNVPTQISIDNLKSNVYLENRMVARLTVKNSFPGQRIRIYDATDNRFMGYSFKTERCEPVRTSSSEYNCVGDIYVTENELDYNSDYYFQSLDRRGRNEGEKAFFTFRK
jgi:hypothetical protein